MIRTFWNTPSSGFDTTTNAGERVTIPLTQSGWQLFKLRVPLPDADALPQDDHTTFVREVPPLPHPMSMRVGRFWGVDPGIQDTTDATVAAGAVTVAAAVVGEDVVVVAGPRGSVVVAAATDLAGGEDALTANPAPKPMPKDPSTAAATSTRTTVLRRRVITENFCVTMKGNGTYGTCHDRGFCSSVMSAQMERESDSGASGPRVRWSLVEGDPDAPGVAILVE